MSSLHQIKCRSLLLLVTILTQTLLALVRGHFMTLSFLTAWHSECFLKFCIQFNLSYSSVSFLNEKRIGRYFLNLFKFFDGLFVFALRL